MVQTETHLKAPRTDMIMPHATVLLLSACAVPLVPDGPWIYASPTVCVITVVTIFIGAKAVITDQTWQDPACVKLFVTGAG